MSRRPVGDDWAVEVDRLLALGDPRGELALATPEPKAHRDLSPAHQHIAASLLGPVQRPVRHVVSWHHGYIREFANWSSSQEDRFWWELFALESMRFLYHLSMRWIRPELLLELLRTHPLPLASLHWNERDEPVDFDPFFEVLPELEHLSLWRPARFRRGSVRPLKTLEVNAGENPGLSDDLRDYAAAGGLAALDLLSLWGTRDLAWVDGVLAHCRPKLLAFKGSIDGSVVGPLIESPAFATVERLTFAGFWPGEEALLQLIAALEQRPPLVAYHSTGMVPAAPLTDRIRACAADCEVRG